MNTLTLEKPVSVSTQKSFDLVKGEFSSAEASEILHDLFSKKICFNTQKRFSEQIRFGKHDPRTDQRIDELQQAHDQALKLIAAAKEDGRSVRISSALSIEIL